VVDRESNSPEESLASPDEDLPGELLGHDLTEPAAYEVTPDETEAEELDAAPVPGPADDVVDDPAQLEAAETVAARARSSRPVRRAAAPVEKKAAPTRRRATVTARAAGPERTTPAKFVGESVEELKKVVWPTWPQVRQYYVVVLVFVLAIMAFVSLLDLAFGWALLKLFA